MHTWNCATFRDQLTTSAYAEHGWEYQATMPTDWLRALRLDYTSTAYRILRYNIEWVIENGVLLTNFTDPYLTFMKEPTPAKMDSLYVQALYTLLASKLAVPVAGDKDRKRELLDEFYSIILPEARRVDGFEERTRNTIRLIGLRLRLSVHQRLTRVGLRLKRAWITGALTSKEK